MNSKMSILMEKYWNQVLILATIFCIISLSYQFYFYMPKYWSFSYIMFVLPFRENIIRNLIQNLFIELLLYFGFNILVNYLMSVFLKGLMLFQYLYIFIYLAANIPFIYGTLSGL
jgi:hypothetical protein